MSVETDKTQAGDERHGLYLEELEIGQRASYARTITETDLILFSGISGDTNPVHLDAEFAATTPFGGRIAHGMIAASLISTVLGTKLPGPGVIYVDQSLKFKAPVRPGDTAIAEAVITGINEKRRRVTLETTVRVGNTIVLTGEATVMVDRKPTS